MRGNLTRWFSLLSSPSSSFSTSSLPFITNPSLLTTTNLFPRPSSSSSSWYSFPHSCRSISSSSSSHIHQHTKMSEREAPLHYLDQHYDHFVSRLSHLARIPSVSDWSQNLSDVLRCAEEVKKEIESVGLEHTQLIQLKNEEKGKYPPCVYGDWLHAEGQPTVLLYAHYDVQPPGNPDLWKTGSAWEPTLRNVPDIGGDRLFGRGTADDKAGILVHVAALESIMKTIKKLPINVKVLFEGEEEIGSVHLEEYLKENLDLLKSDILILTDTGNYDIGIPTLTYSLRGIVSLDVELRTVDHAVHSGMWGGVLLDSLTSLCKLLGTLHDHEGRIAVEGFEEGVRVLSDFEIENLKRLNYTEEKLRKESGLLKGVKVAGESSVTLLERMWYRPAINVIGLDSCNLKESANKILHTAKARISCRIVANQNPEHVLAALKKHLIKHAPYGSHVEFSNEDKLKPWVCLPAGPAIKAAERALELGYENKPAFVGCGGSIGFVEPFANAFGGAPAILIGVEDPYTNAHGENESLLLSDFKKSMKSVLHLFYELRK